jgi:hypothetical protein
VLFVFNVVYPARQVCFQNYTGRDEPDEAKEFIKQRFLELPSDRNKYKIICLSSRFSSLLFSCLSLLFSFSSLLFSSLLFSSLSHSILIFVVGQSTVIGRAL